VTVIIDGRSLTLDGVVRVAGEREAVALDAEARERMERSRVVVERVFAAAQPVYGLTTGYGVQKRVAVESDDVADFNRRQLMQHAVGQGPPAPPDVVRAAALILANSFAGGTTGVRPLLGERLLDALNADRLPAVRSLGSLGASDLAPLADLALGVFADTPLAAGEGLALINSSAYGTATAALAAHATERLLDAADVAGALALEGFAANLSILHPAVTRARPHCSLALAVERFRALLDGSFLWEPGAARNLQDPLTYRGTAAVQAAARDALDHALATLAVELNAAQGNPMVVADEGRIISVANWEVLPLAAVLDYVRVGLAPALLSASERSVKLLDTAWSGLPTGLSATAGRPDLGLSIHAITAESLAAEASLLAQPVSFTVASTSGAEGIEDRATLLPLAGRRLAEMVVLGEGVVAIELLVAAQAVDLRGDRPLGTGTGAAHALLRERVPFAADGDSPPTDLTPLRELIGSGGLGAGAPLDPVPCPRDDGRSGAGRREAGG
jgi:histidine ammonia-lyase